MGACDSVRVFQLKEFQRFDKEAQDYGAHEEGARTAEEAGDGHDLDGIVSEEVGRACSGGGREPT